MKRSLQELGGSPSEDASPSSAPLQKAPKLDDKKYLQVKYKQTCEMYAKMQKCALKLSVPQMTVATAMVFFHKFYSKYSMETYPVETVGAACLFLGGKAESTTLRMKGIIHFFFGVTEAQEEAYQKHRNDITDVELQLIQHLEFDFTVVHPYRFFIKKLDNEIRGSRDWKQLGWRLMNDLYNTTLCIKCPPDAIASAVIHVAAGCIEPTSLPPNWQQHVPVNDELVRKIWSSTLNFYKYSGDQELCAVLEKRQKFRLQRAEQQKAEGQRSSPESLKSLKSPQEHLKSPQEQVKNEEKSKAS
uniref:Cyclin-like domain-containing protein n=1 Tax=Eutreptiella gymnastica TaxID=73025 RepID=A0A7S4G310_9EUGL|mmetsp:Transcript_97056/g.163256  ORF Transcript_97056/g.163256 Transcript_97056/m.163256 type:complete len:301 (+) Transcript_97056:87-989(+)